MKDALELAHFTNGARATGRTVDATWRALQCFDTVRSERPDAHGG
jgi:hypothetical protein